MKSVFSRILCLVLCLFLTFGLFACKDPEEQTVETYMVTFSKNLNDVTVNGMPSPQNVEKGKLVTAPSTNPSTNLYDFTGWYTDASATVLFDFTTVTVSSRLTIYAGWALRVTKYNVTFDLNYSGSATPTVVEVVSGETVNAPANPVREGYRFKFWSTQADESYIFSFSSNVTAHTNLYAMWEKEYTLTYNYNIVDSQPTNILYGDTENTVQPEDPTRLNFSFGGWFTNEALTTVFNHGAKLTSDVTLYAKWVRTSYTVTFNLNYENSTPIIVSSAINSDVPVPQAPTRSGYVFNGWYTSANEQTDENIYDFAAVNNDETVIYAKWTILHAITFNFNYIDSPAVITELVEEGKEVEVFTPSREGFNFSGWFTDSEATVAYDFAAVTAPITLYAKWIDSTEITEEFNVTFDLNYTGTDPITQVVASNTVAVRPADPVREGYRFSGWMTTPTGSTSYKFNPVTEDVIVYARWVNLWKITFNLEYDNAPAPQVVEALDGTRISKPSNPVRAGLWQFVTWNDDNGLPFVFTTLIKQDHQLHAVWTRSGYAITWDFNYVGEPAPVVTNVMIGTIIREPQKPNRDGNWAISGWYLDEALTQPFSLSSELTQDVTLYAKWASGFSYRLDLNYIGASNMPTQILSSGALIPAKPADPIRANYTFVGWSTTASSNPNFNGFGTPITEDITLYAQWRHTYIFEAEYVNLAGKNGAGWSGGAAGTAMITKDTITENPELGTNANASNGFYLTYLYSYGLFIDFVITSDRATEATLILRLSAEQRDPFVITDDEYLVTLNGNKVNYGSITIYGALAALQQQKLPFADVISIPINLVAGTNTIRFTTNNQNSMGGTMDATAPLFDCIKIDTIAMLTWSPLLENLNSFN